MLVDITDVSLDRKSIDHKGKHQHDTYIDKCHPEITREAPPFRVSLTEDKDLNHRIDQMLQNHVREVHLNMSCVKLKESAPSHLNIAEHLIILELYLGF